MYENSIPERLESDEINERITNNKFSTTTSKQPLYTLRNNLDMNFSIN